MLGLYTASSQYSDLTPPLDSTTHSYILRIF